MVKRKFKPERKIVIRKNVKPKTAAIQHPVIEAGSPGLGVVRVTRITINLPINF